MKLKDKYLLAFFFCVMFYNLSAQTIKPLKIGDKVPDIVLEKMLNHTAASGKLSDFDGKAIIIDQWFIGCAPCVSAMSHLDTLQKQFAGELQILPVTFEKKEDVENFWKNNILVRGIKFTQVVEDTLVRSYFPAVSFPQQVWIDKQRKVIAITDDAGATFDNVRKFVNNEALNLFEKKDELDANISAAVFPNIMSRYEQNKKKLLYYSYFSAFRPELKGLSFSTVDTVNSLVRIVCNNASMFKLYDIAYAELSWKSRHLRTRFLRKDTSPIKGQRSSSRADTVFQFCYELIFKSKTIEGFRNRMVSDLDQFFNLKSHEELVDIDCFVIKPNGKGNRFRDVYQIDRKSYQTVSFTKAKRVLINDMPLFFVQDTFNAYSIPLIILEIEGRGRVSFDVSWNLENLTQMNKDLANFDLEIVKTTRKRKVIVLEDL